MNEQIKEMAKDLGIAFQLAGTTRFGAVAEILVNAGYRKAREIFAEIERMCIDTFGNFNHRIFAELKNKYLEADEDDDI